MSRSPFTLAPCDWSTVEHLRSELGCGEVIAWILARRGIGVAEATLLLEQTEPGPFHDPLLLGDMAAAVERTRWAIERGERIVVHGDYDCDGVCSTTLLVEALEQLGAEVHAELPDRFATGYGLHEQTIDRLAAEGTRLLIAVDCGITAVGACARARAHGMDVIVCDHHRPGDELPDAILCSTRPSDYPFPELCATAVVGKLAEALGAPLDGEAADRRHELEAIATVADCVPLVDENRALVQRGVAALRRSTRPGLRALMSAAGVAQGDADAEAIGFRIAPRINAVGRLGPSEPAYHLLRAADVEEAERRAAEVVARNEERREVERGIVAAAIRQVEEEWSDEQRAARCWVVHDRGWHEGVVGIVASRLVERYHRPVLVLGGDDPEVARGSARSIESFDLHAALASAADLFDRWGGHAHAGGCSIRRDRVEELRQRLAAHAAEVLDEADLVPRSTVDAIVAGDELDLSLVDELARLGPFGTGNERPLLLAVGAELRDARGVGRDGDHLQARVVLGGTTVPAIGFGEGARAAELVGRRVDVALRPIRDRWRGAETLKLELVRIAPTSDAVVESLDAAAPAGWCQVRCDLSCDDRVPLESMLRDAAPLQPGLAPVGADEGGLPPLEPLLARACTRDLRNRGRALAHLARMASAGARVVVVCADVSRRRTTLRDLLSPVRMGQSGTRAVLAGDRCSRLGLATRLHRAASHDGGVVVVADYGALAEVLAGPVHPDAVVVLDPPATIAQRDQLLAARAPLHLVWGATEQRFSDGLAARNVDVRGMLAPLWRRLRAEGPIGGADLEQLLLDDGGPHLRMPGPVSAALRTLVDRGLLGLDDAAGSARIVSDPHAPGSARGDHADHAER